MKIEEVSFIASIVSGILAIIAIILSIIFYRMADRISHNTMNISTNVSSVVERLEVFIKTFYTDTFGIMKDTYIDMRDHVFLKDTRYNSSFIEERTEEKLNILKAEMKQELEAIISRVETADIKTDQVRDRLELMLDKAVDESAKAERLTYEEFVIKDALALFDMLLKHNDREFAAIEFIKPFAERHGHRKAFWLLREYRRKGLLEFDPSVDDEIYNCAIRCNREALKLEYKKYIGKTFIGTKSQVLR